MTTMKKKTVNVSGVGSLDLYFGPGDVHIIDKDGVATVEAQGYTLAELQASQAEQRGPVSLHTVTATLSGAEYQAFKMAHPEFTLAIITAAWEVLTLTPDTDSGQKDTNGNAVFVNFFADATDADLGA